MAAAVAASAQMPVPRGRRHQRLVRSPEQHHTEGRLTARLGTAKDWALESVHLYQHLLFVSSVLMRDGRAPSATSTGTRLLKQLPRDVTALLVDRITSQSFGMFQKRHRVPSALYCLLHTSYQRDAAPMAQLAQGVDAPSQLSRLLPPGNCLGLYEFVAFYELVWPPMKIALFYGPQLRRAIETARRANIAGIADGHVVVDLESSATVLYKQSIGDGSAETGPAPAVMLSTSRHALLAWCTEIVLSLGAPHEESQQLLDTATSFLGPDKAEVQQRHVSPRPTNTRTLIRRTMQHAHWEDDQGPADDTNTATVVEEGAKLM